MKKLLIVLCVSALFFGCKSSHKEYVSDEQKEAGDYVIKEAVKDVDGNVYDAVKLGDQVWMAENLRTTSNVKPCPKDEPVYNWPQEPFYVKGNEAELFCSDYGTNEIYYNVFAARSDNLCPKGWHIPSNGDWQKLFDYLASSGYFFGDSETYIAKALASNNGWEYYTNPIPEVYAQVGCNPLNTNNTTGFNAQPNGHVLVQSSNSGGHLQLKRSLFRSGLESLFWCNSPDDCFEKRHDVTNSYEFGIFNNTLHISWNSKNPWIAGGVCDGGRWCEIDCDEPWGHEDFNPIRCLKDDAQTH